MKDFSKFQHLQSNRAGWSGYTPPYGLYQIPLSSARAIYCFLSAGESLDEAGWEHVSVSVRHAMALPSDHFKKARRGLSGAWKRRWPTMDEITLVRDTFWEGSEAVIQVFPTMDLVARGLHDFTVHLWSHRSGMYLPPALLLECFQTREAGGSGG